MGLWRNCTNHELTCWTDGSNPEGKKVVQPGGLLTLDDRQDYIAASQFGRGQLEPVDLTAFEGRQPEAPAEAKPAKTRASKE